MRHVAQHVESRAKLNNVVCLRIYKSQAGNAGRPQLSSVTCTRTCCLVETRRYVYTPYTPEHLQFAKTSLCKLSMFLSQRFYLFW